MSSKEKMQQLLSYAGIQINGDRDWDIQVHDERIYSRFLSGGSLALGESYMNGWWDARHLDQFFTLVLRSDLAKEALGKHTSHVYIEAKTKEWDEYRTQVTKWEIEKYFEST